MFDFLKKYLTNKEYEVIQKRYFENKTLQAIGDEMALTRERIRQIQNNGINKLKRIIETTKVQAVIEKIEQHLQKNSNFTCYKNLQNHFQEHTIGELELIVDTSQNIDTIKKTQNFKHSCGLNNKVDKGKLNQIHKKIIQELKKNSSPINTSKFIIEIQKKQDGYTSQKTIQGIIEISEQTRILDNKVGHISCREVNPKSIKDKAIIVLERAHQPLHFRDINQKIHQEKFDRKTVTLEAVHNELIRYEDFVLVGRGLYALSKWGYTKGTVKDIIHQILKANGALPKKLIVEKVLEQRKVKIGTISLNLQKYPEFKRVGRATYSL